MRILSLLALTFALPAAALAEPKPGDRTTSPEQLLRDLGLADEPDDLRDIIAEADGHPLGSGRNPVRVGGPAGERAYIARLRCADGSSPSIGQRGSAGIGAFGTIVDVYPVDCGAKPPGKAEIVMDMYHAEHQENRAPPGFTIVPR